MLKTYATADLKIKPKNQEKDVEKVKDQEITKIHPSELGVGLVMEKTSKNDS